MPVRRISPKYVGVREVLNRVREKWTVLVIATLDPGSKRFGELRRDIERVSVQLDLGCISHRMLTLTLRLLERDGLITRTVHPTVPPKVEYGLTTLGRGLRKQLRGLGDWGIRNYPRIERARTKYDAQSRRNRDPGHGV